MQPFDVVILGAGPAGAATALALRKSHPNLSSVMVEASDFQSLRPGEILAADAEPVLRQLDVFDCFTEQIRSGVLTRSRRWGAAASHSFDFTLSESGWHLDRSRFDGMLAGVAAASGVGFIRASFSDARATPSGNWQITAQSALAKHTILASFVVDATGRNARFASEIGIPQAAHDTLVGVVRVIEPEYRADEDVETVIEAFEHGWWYSAPLAGNRLMIGAMTDADIGKRLHLTDIAQWNDQLCSAPRTRQRLATLPQSGELHVRAANTRGLYFCSGINWLAVGDAAASIDPLHTSGIVRALRFGIYASDAIGAHFNRNESSLRIYDNLVQSELRNCVRQCTEEYRKEKRWEYSPFWTRRQPAPSRNASNTTERRSNLLSIRDPGISREFGALMEFPPLSTP